MPRITQLVGLVLLVVGVVGYLATDRASVTALLPAALGLVLLVLGLLAARLAEGRHAIHAALVVALLGALGSLPRIAGIGDGEPAAIVSLLTTVACLAYVGLGVRSFLSARRSRTTA
jgi:uncharacterized membrane protein